MMSLQASLRGGDGGSSRACTAVHTTTSVCIPVLLNHMYIFLMETIIAFPRYLGVPGSFKRAMTG